MKMMSYIIYIYIIMIHLQKDRIQKVGIVMVLAEPF